MSTDAGEPKGYALFQEEITDPKTFLTDYVPTARETIEAHGGEILVSAVDPQVLEGEWDHSNTVVIEFPSVADAEAWYTDPYYEAVIPVRQDACEYANAAICPGFVPEGRPD